MSSVALVIIWIPQTGQEVSKVHVKHVLVEITRKDAFLKMEDQFACVDLGSLELIATREVRKITAK